MDEHYPNSRYFPQTGTIILWADGVSLWMNIITSHDQFKPLRIGEKLVVNYNKQQYTSFILSRNNFIVIAMK